MATTSWLPQPVRGSTLFTESLRRGSRCGAQDILGCSLTLARRSESREVNDHMALELDVKYVAAFLKDLYFESDNPVATPRIKSTNLGVEREEKTALLSGVTREAGPRERGGAVSREACSCATRGA